MAQDISKLQADGKNLPAKKPAAKVEARKQPVLWSNISKKFLLPASILMVAAGLCLAALNVLLITGTLAIETTLTLGMKISSMVLGAFMIVTGVFGLLKIKKKLTMTFGVLALIYAIILLTATAKTGAIAIASGVAAIVLSLIFIVAVDGMFDLGLIRFFREMNGEVRKLTWLSGKELFSHTLAVVVFVLAMAAIIYLLDLAFSSGFSAVSNIKIG